MLTAKEDVQWRFGRESGHKINDPPVSLPRRLRAEPVDQVFVRWLPGTAATYIRSSCSEKVAKKACRAYGASFIYDAYPGLYGLS